MPINDSTVRTIACDAAGCSKSLIFERNQEKVVFENPDNSWLRGVRVVQSADGRNMAYCSDICEVNGVSTGKHNIPEPPTIVPATNSAAVAVAAQAAAHARQTEAAIRSGQPAKVQLTD
jgi:hypothetical protein